VNIFFYIDLLALKIGTCVINIENLLFHKFHGKKRIFNPWEAIKVGSSEKKFVATHVGRFLKYFFW